MLFVNQRWQRGQKFLCVFQLSRLYRSLLYLVCEGCEATFSQGVVLHFITKESVVVSALPLATTAKTEKVSEIREAEAGRMLRKTSATGPKLSEASAVTVDLLVLRRRSTACADRSRPARPLLGAFL